MKKEDYYALINYRGIEKYYHVSASMSKDEDGYDTRIEYIDYNPERESEGVWIKNGGEKIIEKFEKGSPQYKYFKKLYKNWNIFMKEELERLSRVYKEEVYYLGTDYVRQCYRKALKETFNPLNIEISPKRNKNN